MAPTYEVEIPEKLSSLFEKSVQNLGGEIVRRRLSLKDIKERAESVWSAQARLAQALIQEFKRQHDPTIEAQINEAVRKLVNDVFKHQEIKANVSLTELRKALTDFFDCCAPEKMPKWVYPRHSSPNSKERVGFQHPSSKLLPNQITYLIENYGLNDGKPKTMKEIGENHNISKGAVRQHIEKTRRTIWMIPEIRELVIADGGR